MAQSIAARTKVTATANSATAACHFAERYSELLEAHGRLQNGMTTLKEQFRQIRKERQIQRQVTGTTTPSTSIAATKVEDASNVSVINNKENTIITPNEILTIISGTQQCIAECVMPSTHSFEVHSTIDTSPATLI